MKYTFSVSKSTQHGCCHEATLVALSADGEAQDIAEFWSEATAEAVAAVLNQAQEFVLP